MKNLTFLFALPFLLIPSIVFATSGACSGHGGVSCASGADNDGSVICNDGWRNSSVSYSSMKMCGGSPVTKTSTTKSVPSKTVAPTSVQVTNQELPNVVPEVSVQPKQSFWKRLFNSIFK